MFDRAKIIKSINDKLEKCPLLYLVALNETLQQHTKGIINNEGTQKANN